MEITGKTAEIYEFIVDYVSEHLYSPTIREIGKGVDLKSTSSVYAYMQRLINAGLIRMNFAEPRTIQLIGYKIIKDNEKEL